MCLSDIPHRFRSWQRGLLILLPRDQQNVRRILSILCLACSVAPLCLCHWPNSVVLLYVYLLSHWWTLSYFQDFALVFNGLVNIHELVSLKIHLSWPRLLDLFFSWPEISFVLGFALYLVTFSISITCKLFREASIAQSWAPELLGVLTSVLCCLCSIFPVLHLVLPCSHFSFSHSISHSLRLVPAPVACSKSVSGIHEEFDVVIFL